MNRPGVIVTAAILAAAFGLAWHVGSGLPGAVQAQPNVRRPGEAVPRWQYGVYRVRSGRATYEWIDGQRYLAAATAQGLVERLGQPDLLSRMQATYVDASQPYPDYLVDMALLNHLGSLGWELIGDEAPAATRGRVYTFRRPVP